VRRALLVVALASAGCATATNYLDVSGPFFETKLGRAQDARTGLRVVTFNIENGRRVQQAVTALREHPALCGADVLVLQEMDAAGVESIAQALALNAVYYPATNLKGRDLGNAVLSPFPIVASWKVLLPHRSRIVKKGRAAVAARIQVDGQAIVVYSVHLGSPVGFSGGQRREQAEAVLADAMRSSDPVVIAGDFNSKSVGRVFESAGFAWPTKGVGKTVGWFSFDHIFSRGLGGDGKAAGVAREVKDASDHRPVWAVLTPGNARACQVPALEQRR
jgi:endonuclease/exonuclease/phosphatase family metal-dependent hydrolase